MHCHESIPRHSRCVKAINASVNRFHALFYTLQVFFDSDRFFESFVMLLYPGYSTIQKHADHSLPY